MKNNDKNNGKKNYLLRILLPQNFNITNKSPPQTSKYCFTNLVLASLHDVGQEGHEGAHIPTDHGNPTINGNRDSD